MSYIKSRKHRLTTASRSSGIGLGTALLMGLAASNGATAADEPIAPAAETDDIAPAQGEEPAPAAEETDDDIAPAQGEEPAPAAPEADSVEPGSTVLPDMTVTGQDPGNYYQSELSSPKFAKPISKTGKTIQIIDKPQMEDQHATSLQDAMRNTPGVGAFSMGETGSSSTGDSLYMRGMDASGSIFVDGVRDAGDISRDLFNTEQVEVIKGADGSLFGRTSLNGTINMVTKEAHLGDDNQAQLSAGTHHHKRGTLDINRELGDHTAFRLNLMGENSEVPGRDRTKNRIWGIAPALAFGLDTDTRLHLNYEHSQQRNQPDGGVVSVGMPGYTSPDPVNHPEYGDAPQPSSKNYYGTNSDFEHITKDQATAKFEWDLTDDLMFHNTARWAKTRQNYMLSSFMSDPNDSWDMNDFSNWEARRSVNTKNQSNTILTNQAGFVQELTTGPLEHRFSYGTEFSYEKADLDDTEPQPDAPPINIYNPQFYGSPYEAQKTGTGATGRATTIAGYFFDNIDIGEDWQLNGGVRVDRYRLKYDRSAFCDAGHGQAPQSCALPPDQSDHVTATDNFTQRETLVSWQVGALYQMNKYGNIYGQYAVANQPPGNDSLVLSPKAKYGDHPGYEPQEAKTLEFGTKWSLLNDQLLLSGAIFRTRVNNQVEQEQGGGNDFVQTGKKRIQGIELSAVGQITPNWNVSVGYTHLDTKITDGASEAADGSLDLNYAPSDAFTSWTTYRLPVGLTLGGGARYVGDMTRDAKSTPGTPKKIRAYWIIDAMAKYRIDDNLSVQLNGYNLGNKKYVASINKKGHRYLPGQSRSAILSLNMDF